MMFVSEKFSAGRARLPSVGQGSASGRKVVLVTTHLALSEVAAALSKKRVLEKIILAEETLKRYFRRGGNLRHRGEENHPSFDQISAENGNKSLWSVSSGHNFLLSAFNEIISSPLSGKGKGEGDFTWF